MAVRIEGSTTRLEELMAQRTRIEVAIRTELERLNAAFRGSAGLPGCGTDSGYYHHRRQLKEPACPACKMAHAYARRMRTQRANTTEKAS
jgi:hypothetical protein